MNKEKIEGKWLEIKGDLNKAWGRVTDDEWEKTKGDVTQIAGLVQQRYGQSKEDATHKVSRLFEKYVSDPAKKILKSDDDKH